MVLHQIRLGLLPIELGAELRKTSFGFQNLLDFGIVHKEFQFRVAYIYLVPTMCP